jgi:hypothetical protein
VFATSDRSSIAAIALAWINPQGILRVYELLFRFFKKILLMGNS